ncbi:MAG: hypothetical protein ACREOF_13915 [Gemmatimonadales bacterium]
MAWKELAPKVGTQAVVDEFRSIEGRVSKRQYKRLIATAVAQLLELHPKLGRGKARRWARKATGVRPLKQAGAAAGAGAAKVVRSLARPLKKRATRAVADIKEAGSGVAPPAP